MISMRDCQGCLERGVCCGCCRMAMTSILKKIKNDLDVNEGCQGRMMEEGEEESHDGIRKCP